MRVLKILSNCFHHKLPEKDVKMISLFLIIKMAGNNDTNGSSYEALFGGDILWIREITV